jgi:ribose 5-phosphate isomerase RpiB
MRIAVVNEVSACQRNAVIVRLLEDAGHQALNLGLSDPAQQPSLTYLQTGLISALALKLGLADFVIGGCGTGIGYMNSVLQYPGMVCGLLLEPSDAWLFTRINDGNCASLALNKGYGWAGDLNLKMIFRELFSAQKEGGYPSSRVESQTASRQILNTVSDCTHRPMEETLDLLPDDVVRPVIHFEPFMQYVREAEPSALRSKVLSLPKE